MIISKSEESESDVDDIVNPARFTTIREYMESRGPHALARYLIRPPNPEIEITNAGTIDELRQALRRLEINNPSKPPLHKPIQIKVRGTLFPSGLLCSGWWQRLTRGRSPDIEWVSDVQRWHFIGFNEWGPSWDFSWQLDRWTESRKKMHFFAQFGDGDEGDSLPVYISQAEAWKVRDSLDKWGGMTAEITGLVGHRSHFPDLEGNSVKDAGGWMNYCLWLDPDNKKHRIEPLSYKPDIYSGYLWKCIAPRCWVEQGALGPQHVFHIWVHADYSRPDALAFSKDLLLAKEKLMAEHIRMKTGDDRYVLLAKSSSHLDGEPLWGLDEISQLLELKMIPRK